MKSATHPLDNPVWNAVLTGNKALAKGTATVQTFADEVSPIAGMEDYGPENFTALHQMASSTKPTILFSVDELIIPDNWQLLVKLPGLQMVYTGSALHASNTEGIIPLSPEHIPQMLALTALTNPGPFSARTIEFGSYEGILKNGQLVAMAGQRLFPKPYVEISAVCTHPDYAGQGLAKQLLQQQIHHIIHAGNIPFLHVRSDNSNAIKLYETLGFTTRSLIYFYVLLKKE